MESIVSIIGTLVGIEGISYGIYQDRTKAQVEKLMRQNSWSVYRTCYKTFEKIWALHESSRNDVPTDLAKAEASIRELHRKCIQQVIHQYSDLTEDDLITWKETGKLADQFSLDEFRREIGS